MPKVSVVLPVFNSSATIVSAVQSLLAQTWTDFELIVVDDGSQDATLAQVQALTDPRLRVVQAEHRGVVQAANHGCHLARGELIARMDADDVAYPHRLALQVRALETEGWDVVGSAVRIRDPQQRPVSSWQRYEHWINHETAHPDEILGLRFVEFPLVNPTLLARRAYFELGFRDNGFPEDYDLMLRAASRGMRFGKVPETLLDWHDHAARLTRRHRRYRDQAFVACRRWHLRQGPLREVTHVDLWGWGPTGKTWQRWLITNGIQIRRGYDVHPRRIGGRIHGVPIASPDTLPRPDGVPLLIAVGRVGARPLIRQHLRQRHYRLGQDAWFVA